VVATGFSSTNETVAPESPEEHNEEVIQYEDWIKLQRGMSQGMSPSYLLGRNSEEGDLGIPTVLRDRKAVGQQGEE
jgi:cell division protein FtsZ